MTKNGVSTYVNKVLTYSRAHSGALTCRQNYSRYPFIILIIQLCLSLSMINEVNYNASVLPVLQKIRTGDNRTVSTH